MGDGLKRAFAATARTRADARLMPEMRRFLGALSSEGIRTPRELSVPASYAQSLARQQCQKFGYAWMITREDGKRAWQLTDAGRAALALPVLAGRS